MTISNPMGGTFGSEIVKTVTTSGALVVPAGLANVEGSGYSGDLTVSVREQNVYGASYFPTQTIVITGIRFPACCPRRPGVYEHDFEHQSFSLSSTPAAPDQNLSSIYADNIGTNVTTVFNGSLLLSSEYAWGR